MIKFQNCKLFFNNKWFFFFFFSNKKWRQMFSPLRNLNRQKDTQGLTPTLYLYPTMRSAAIGDRTKLMQPFAFGVSRHSHTCLKPTLSPSIHSLERWQTVAVTKAPCLPVSGCLSVEVSKGGLVFTYSQRPEERWGHSAQVTPHLFFLLQSLSLSFLADKKIR